MRLQSEGAPVHNAPGAHEQAEVKSDQTRLLYANLPLSIAVTLVIAAMLGYAMRDQVSQTALFGWCAIMVVVSGLRAAAWFAWQRKAAEANAAHQRWQIWFDACSLAAGSAWGAAAVLIFPAESLAHQVFLGFVLACMAAGGISTLAVRLKSYVAFLVPTLVPYSTQLVAQGGELQIFMGAVFLLGLGFLLVNARRFESVTVNALSLRHENEKLVTALRSALHDAENSNKAKTQFLTTMSHEIRTPLSGMMGMAELLMKTSLNAQQQRLAGTVNQSAAALLGLVEDLLDVSRIESGNFTLDRQDFELRSTIEGAVELCAGAGYRKGLEIQLIVGGNLPVLVNGDAKRLHQIVVNLISSTVGFTDVGHITLRIECRSKEKGGYDLVCMIADNGIGIARKDMARLLSPLTEPVDPKQKSGGADLSLTITRCLLDMMGGEVALSCEIGKGTTIRFSIPLDAASIRPLEMEPELAALAGKRVLVLDDRGLSREAMVTQLACSTARIEIACSEDEALAKLRRGAREGDPYHLALIDRVRARTDNIGIHRKIANSPDLSETRVVALMPMRWTLDEGLEREFGAASFLSKPIRRASLISAIEAVLGSNRRARGKSSRSSAIEFGKIASSSAQFAKTGSSSAFDGLKVLIAEDNVVNREVALGYLAGFGCAAQIAQNGLEAIAACETSRFDLVLMDCQMPEVDGLAAIRHIRAREQSLGLPRTPIVVVTANAFASDRDEALAAGADSFLAKPYNEAQLKQAMGNCFQRAAA